MPAQPSQAQLRYERANALGGRSDLWGMPWGRDILRCIGSRQGLLVGLCGDCSVLSLRASDQVRRAWRFTRNSPFKTQPPRLNLKRLRASHPPFSGSGAEPKKGRVREPFEARRLVSLSLSLLFFLPFLSWGVFLDDGQPRLKAPFLGAGVGRGKQGRPPFSQDSKPCVLHARMFPSLEHQNPQRDSQTRPELRHLRASGHRGDRAALSAHKFALSGSEKEPHFLASKCRPQICLPRGTVKRRDPKAWSHAAQRCKAERLRTSAASIPFRLKMLPSEV